MRACLLAALAGCLACAPSSEGPSQAPPPAAAAEVPAGWVEEVVAWRADREERLRGADGWLTLVALHWLEPGTTTFGAAPGNTLALPAGSAPDQAGAFEYDGRQVTVVPAAGATITLDGAPIGRRTLQDDAAGTPDVLQVGRLSMNIVGRSGRHGVRVKDPESPVRTGFTGLDWYPIDPAWRVVARYTPRAAVEEKHVANVLGSTTLQYVPGDVTFTLDGAEQHLVPLVSDPADTHFFFIFKDRTSGRETYGAGRYLYGDLEGDRVVLDFNKAYNMPCVFTPYATCILPPPENRLDLAVAAGEKMFGEHH